MSKTPPQTFEQSTSDTSSNIAEDADHQVKIICLGDSAVGKSKLVERFLCQGFKPHQLSTYALTMHQHKVVIDGEKVTVDIWDTAGQERFHKLHSTYYHNAHVCIMVFDITRKITYKNLVNWHKELREFRADVPCLCAANKIDVDESVTKQSFQLPKKFGMPLYFVSAANGTNVVKLFNDAINIALQYKKNPTDYVDQILQELDNISTDEEADDDGKFLKK